MLEKSEKNFFSWLKYVSIFHSGKVRVEMPDINTGRGHAKSYHFSLLQIIPHPNYFTEIPPLLFLRPSGKEAT